MDGKRNLTEALQNPRSIALKKWVAQLLGNRWAEYDDLLSRCAAFLVTEQDLEAFGKLLIAVHDAGFMRAVEDYKPALAKMGIAVTAGPKNPGDSPRG